MKEKRFSDEEFVSVWMRLQSAQKVADHLGIQVRDVYKRRAAIQEERGQILPALSPRAKYTVTIPENKIRVQVTLDDGVFVVFSDAHYWPNMESTAHRALKHLLPEIKPKLLIANGDIFDGATISRHDRIGYEQRPSVKQELEAVQSSLKELEDACKGAGTKFIRTIGNHCIRFDSRLANELPQYEGLAGMSLDDHLYGWLSCWSVMINEDGHHPVMIKHRWHNGIHAIYNNTLKGGISIFTGHLHALDVKRWSDYRGTRFGVDTGTLADPYGAQFNYMEDNSRNWRSGFAVGTISEGKLMPPELCEVVSDNSVWWRGKLIELP